MGSTMSNRSLAWLLALFVAGCNDSMHVRSPSSEEAPPAGPTAEAATEAARPESPERKARTEPAADAATEDPSGFDPDMAQIVLKRGQKQAVQCPSVAKDTPVGEGEIVVIIDGRTGKIVDVELGNTFTAGSSMGQACLKNAFIGQIVTPFQGQKKVPFTLNVPAAPAPEKDAKKKP